jgi:hypothetical protein
MSQRGKSVGVLSKGSMTAATVKLFTDLWDKKS